MPVPKGRCSQRDSQGNRNASQAMPNSVAVDDASGNDIEMSAEDQTVKTVAGPEAGAVGEPEAEDHVIEGLENPGIECDRGVGKSRDWWTTARECR